MSLHAKGEAGKQWWKWDVSSMASFEDTQLQCLTYSFAGWAFGFRATVLCMRVILWNCCTLLCHLASMLTDFHFFEGNRQTVMTQLDWVSLLMLSRKFSTKSRTLTVADAEQCHSSSNGCSTISGPSLKNWRRRDASLKTHCHYQLVDVTQAPCRLEWISHASIKLDQWCRLPVTGSLETLSRLETVFLLSWSRLVLVGPRAMAMVLKVVVLVLVLTV